MKSVARGVSLTYEEMLDVISYADLARGIFKIVEERNGMWIGNDVGFVARGGKKVKSLLPTAFISVFGWVIEVLSGLIVEGGKKDGVLVICWIMLESQEYAIGRCFINLFIILVICRLFSKYFRLKKDHLIRDFEQKAYSVAI